MPRYYTDGMTDLNRDLSFLLNDIARMLRTEVDRHARAYGMTRAQWGILLWLEREPGLSQRQLATILDVEPITVARLVDRLERSGAVERRPDSTDRRVWRLHLAAEAVPLLRDIHRCRHGMADFLTKGLAPGARAAMLDGLVHMKNLLSSERRADARDAA